MRRVGHGEELFTGFGHAFKALHFHGDGGTGFLDLLALVVHQGAHAAGELAAHEVVALVQGAFLDEHGGHGAAALVQLGFHDAAVGGLVGVGLEVHDLGLQGHQFQQVVQALTGLGGDLGHDGVAAPVFGLQAHLGQFTQHAVGIGAGLVHLVDGHHDGHTGGARVVHGFAGLLHDAVVGGHHQDDQVGDLGAAGAHGGEGLVTGGVEEDDLAALGLHMVGTDMLGDAAGFAAGDVGLADGVQQRGLAVVDVAHDGDDRRTGLEIFGLILLLGQQVIFFGEAGLFHFVVEFGGH